MNSSFFYFYILFNAVLCLSQASDNGKIAQDLVKKHEKDIFVYLVMGFPFMKIGPNSKIMTVLNKTHRCSKCNESRNEYQIPIKVKTDDDDAEEEVFIIYIVEKESGDTFLDIKGSFRVDKHADESFDSMMDKKKYIELS